MIFSEEKKQEITDLLIQAGRTRITTDNKYKVEFFESEENMITKFSIVKGNEEILNIQNLMTPQGFQDLEDTKGWEFWAVEMAEVLKREFYRKRPNPRKNWFLRLFGKK